MQFVGSICSDSCAKPEFSSSNKKRKVSSEESDAENIGNAEKIGDQASPEISGRMSCYCECSRCVLFRRISMFSNKLVFM